MATEPRATKQAMLASNNRVVGGDDHGNGFARRAEDVRVVDL